jgi:hypothetical protein
MVLYPSAKKLFHPPPAPPVEGGESLRESLLSREGRGGRWGAFAIPLTPIVNNGRIASKKEFPLKNAFVYTDRYFEYDYGFSHSIE